MKSHDEGLQLDMCHRKEAKQRVDYQLMLKLAIC